MTGQPRTSPYAWVSWLAKALTGEQPCEWSLQFQSMHQGYDKVPDTGNLALWTISHARQVKRRLEALRIAGYAVKVEDQNKGVYRSKLGLAVGYKPDLIAEKNGIRKVIDVKTGQPRTSDTVQVILYMLMAKCDEGEVYYSKTGQTVPLSTEAADEGFFRNLNETIERILAVEPALKLPGPNCDRCPITSRDCPERIEHGKTRKGSR